MLLNHLFQRSCCQKWSWTPTVDPGSGAVWPCPITTRITPKQFAHGLPWGCCSHTPVCKVCKVIPFSSWPTRPPPYHWPLDMPVGRARFRGSLYRPILQISFIFFALILLMFFLWMHDMLHPTQTFISMSVGNQIACASCYRYEPRFDETAFIILQV